MAEVYRDMRYWYLHDIRQSRARAKITGVNTRKDIKSAQRELAKLRSRWRFEMRDGDSKQPETTQATVSDGSPQVAGTLETAHIAANETETDMKKTTKKKAPAKAKAKKAPVAKKAATKKVAKKAATKKVAKKASNGAAKEPSKYAAKNGTPHDPRKDSLIAGIVKLLSRTKGCTRADILELTGWKAVNVHQVSAGHKVKIDKSERPFRYSIAS